MGKQEIQPNRFITCNVCNGYGYTEKGRCQNCQGLGIGLNSYGKFLYWNKTVNSTHILQRKFHKIINQIINIFLMAIGAGGFLLLFWRIYEIDILNIFNSNFWYIADWRLTIFWVSIIFDMYLFYRLSREREKIKKIPKRRYDEESIQKIVLDDWKKFNSLSKKQKIEISQFLTENSLSAIENAYSLAKKFNHKQVDLIHLFYGLLLQDKISLVFGRLGINFKDLKDKLTRALNSLEQGNYRIFSLKLKQILLSSYEETFLSKGEQVDVMDLLVSLLREESIVKEILYDMGVEFDQAVNVISWVRINDNLRKLLKKFKRAAKLKPGTAMNRTMTAVATPYLDRFSEDLTWLARAGYLEYCVNREKELKEIFRIIEGGGKGVILIGQPGVGKDTVVNGIAWRMVEEDVPKILQDKRLVRLSIAELISGATASEAQERLLRCIYEIERAGNIILVIPNIQDMAGITAGSEESLDLSEVLVSGISRGKIISLATAKPRDYTQYIENTAIGSAMKKVNIEEMDLNSSIQVLENKANAIEYKNKIYFSYHAIETAVKLSDRYLHEQYLPAKAIDILKEVAVQTKGKKEVITSEDVAGIIAEKTKIPITQVTKEEGEKLLNLEAEIHKRIIGQEEAVKQVSAALRRARAELRSDKRPIANFLFLGPTGVGKTELAKTVAATYFGSEETMIRLDMSEYQEQRSIDRLIGSPDGSSTGFLTEAVRKNPFSLLLLDEIEKAHPDILNIFLQVMDDGRLTDNQGRTIDFTNVILIATSNAGTQYIQDSVQQGLSIEEIKNNLLNQELKTYFRPEFLNRFDGIIVFKPLTEEEIVQIAKLMLKKVAKRLEKKGISFKSSEEATRELAKKGFDPLYGARPLRRVIQEEVDNALANFLLSGKIERRDVAVLKPGGEIRIEKAEKL